MVAYTLEALAVSAGCIISSLGLGPEDTGISMMPLWHAGETLGNYKDAVANECCSSASCHVFACLDNNYHQIGIGFSWSCALRAPRKKPTFQPLTSHTHYHDCRWTDQEPCRPFACWWSYVLRASL